MKTPTKDTKTAERLEFNVLEDASPEESLDTIGSYITETKFNPEEDDLEELRKLWVGEVDITEGSCRFLSALRRVSDRFPA